MMTGSNLGRAYKSTILVLPLHAAETHFKFAVSRFLGCNSMETNDGTRGFQDRVHH